MRIIQVELPAVLHYVFVVFVGLFWSLSAAAQSAAPSCERNAEPCIGANCAPSDGRTIRNKDILFMEDATIDLSAYGYEIDAGPWIGFVRIKIGGMPVLLRVYMPKDVK